MHAGEEDQEVPPPAGAEGGLPPRQPPAAQQVPQGQAGQQIPAEDMDIAQARQSLLRSQQEIARLEGANQALLMQNNQPGAVAAIENIAPNKVPFWSGGPSDSPADVWTMQVAKLRGINRWTEAQTLDAIYLSLQGPAGEWYKAIVRDEGFVVINTFDKFQERFLSRFQLTRTAAEAVKQVAQLHQRSNEPVHQFMDRCTNAVYDAHAHILLSLEEEEAAGYQRALRSTIAQHFIAGLLPSIRAQVMTKASDLTDKKALLKVAATIESSLVTRPSMVAVAEVQAATDLYQDSEIAALTKKIANLEAVSKSRNRGGRNRRGGRNKTRGGAASRPAPPANLSVQEKVARRTRWAYCDHCRQWGLHYADECGLSHHEASRLTPMDKNKAPGGRASDKQF